jgi:hypothetical protein
MVLISSSSSSEIDLKAMQYEPVTMREPYSALHQLTPMQLLIEINVENIVSVCVSKSSTRSGLCSTTLFRHFQRESLTRS